MAEEVTRLFEELNIGNNQELVEELQPHDEDVGHDHGDEEVKSSDNELAIRDEAQRLLKEIKIAIEQIKRSRFYANLAEKIKGDAFQCQLKRVLGSNYSQLNMVIYALGSLEFCFCSIFQLAIALLLKQDFPGWIGGVEAYDPVFSPADVIVLKELGCEVLLVNERCRRRVEKPTLFYMPYADFHLEGDLLGANWCPSRIDQLILLKSSYKLSFDYSVRKNSKTKFYATEEDYKYAIHKHTKEILIKGGYGGIYDNIFYNFAFHFFEVDSQLDMETLIPDVDGKLSKKRLERQREHDMMETDDYLWEQECSEEFFMEPFAKDAPKKDWAHRFGDHRGPRKYRCFWSPPPRGWIKLNFGGRSSNNGENLAGFGGICHNEYEEPILIYKGGLDKVDQTVASVEALRFGLTQLLKIPKVTRNLIVEGDDLMVTQWANKRQLEHPEEIHESLITILSLLEEFNSVVYHIYEEANLVANNLAKKGAGSRNHHVDFLGKFSEDLGDVDNFLSECSKLEE